MAGSYASYLWSNGETSSSISVQEGVYSVIVFSAEGCEGISNEVNVVEAPWCVTATNSSHELNLLDSSQVLFDGTPLPLGSFIGVFYDDNGTATCAGWLYWEGTNASFIAYGDDPLQVGNQGFASGEPFVWKYYLSTTSQEVTVNASYSVAFPDLANFSQGGSSGILSLYPNAVQDVSIVSSWSFFSTYIIPDNPTMEAVFAGMTNEFYIVKDDAGGIYWPSFGINFIGSFIVGEAYQIRAFQPFTLSVAGTQVVPENEVLTLPVGWSFLGYLRTTAADITTMLAPVVSNIQIVKDSDGNVYLPNFGINFIGNMEPGKGYSVLVTNSFNFTYPPNGSTFSKSYPPSLLPYFERTPTTTGENMTLVILKDEQEETQSIAEIAIYNQQDQCVGAARRIGSTIAFPLWGQDAYSDIDFGLNSNESFHWKAFDQDGFEVPVSLRFTAGSHHYLKDGLAVAELTLSDKIVEEQIIFYPNPSSNQLYLDLQGAESFQFSLEIVDLTGRSIYRTSCKNWVSGQHDLTAVWSNLAPGQYLLRVSGREQVLTKILTKR